MSFRCPYCEFRIAVKTPPKPGKYTPKCPKCGAKIALTVVPSADEWQTAKIAGEVPNIPSPGEATEPSVPAEPPRSSKQNAAPPVDEVTAHFGSTNQDEQTEATRAFSAPSPGVEDRTLAQQSSSPPAYEPTAVFSEADKTKAGAGPTVASGGRKKAKPVESMPEIPDQLGGYEIVKELGRGGMGAVFLARQVSLDRPVALKVMNSKWSNDPVFLARFTREAFAAAQLVHHNVVQIYDIGEQDGVNFFSMEFVEGNSLGDSLKKTGPLAPDDAIAYTLQAARGLKFAHERGMIHRDIKPDNLMLNTHGIVKVADLGLVKTPGMSADEDALPATDPDTSVKSMAALRSMSGDITQVGSAMGSPSYMSPEQCKDAAHVDSRADIYSLGCTLFALLAGKPPFQGNNVFEVMAKHGSEAPPPVPGVSKEVNAVVQRMLAKKPDDRYATTDELIADLEQLMPGKGGPFRPGEEHLKALEGSVKRFQTAGMAKVRKSLILAFFLGLIIAAIGGAFASAWVPVIAITLGIETVLAYFVIDGLLGKSHVFRRARQWALGARLVDWGIVVLGGAAVLLVLFLVGLLWVALGTAVGALLIAFLFHAAIDRPLAGQRRPAIEDCEIMLKRLRINGMEEDALRLFVAKNAGRGWEEYFEALFGFESKLAARPAVEQQAGQKLPRFAAWREMLVARFERAEEARKLAKAQKVLLKLETKKLLAEGVDKKEAAAQAEAMAEVMVEQAVEIKAAKTKPINVRKMVSGLEKQPKRPVKKKGIKLSKVVDTILGWQARFVVGMVLIGLGALWVRGQLKQVNLAKVEGTIVQGNTGTEGAKQAATALFPILQVGRPPEVPVIGGLLGWCHSLNPLIAGLLIVLSTFNPRAIGVNLSLVGAAITLLGHQFGVLPTLGPIEPHQLTMILGVVVAGVGVYLSRRG